MRRYVKEFGKDMYETYYKRAKENPHLEATYNMQKITSILRHCEKGTISDFEAVKAIVKIYDDTLYTNIHK